MCKVILCSIAAVIPICGVPEAVHHIQYVVMRHKKDDMDLFAEETDTDTGSVKPLSFEQYQKLIAQLGKRSKDPILPYR